MIDRHKRKTLERLNAGQFDAALLAARKWVALERSPEALYTLALCYSRTGAHQPAVASIEDLLQGEEDRRDGIALLALTRYQMRDYSSARELLKRMGQLGGELSEQTLLMLAELYRYRQGCRGERRLMAYSVEKARS